MIEIAVFDTKPYDREHLGQAPRDGLVALGQHAVRRGHHRGSPAIGLLPDLGRRILDATDQIIIWAQQQVSPTEKLGAGEKARRMSASGRFDPDTFTLTAWQVSVSLIPPN